MHLLQLPFLLPYDDSLGAGAVVAAVAVAVVVAVAVAVVLPLPLPHPPHLSLLSVTNICDLATWLFDLSGSNLHASTNASSRLTGNYLRLSTKCYLYCL